MKLPLILVLLQRGAVRAFRDNCFEIAKGAAYSSILSFFPGLMVVAALLFRQNVGDIVEQISRTLASVLPPEAHRLATQYLFAPRQRRGLLVGAGFVAIWSSASAILSLTHGFRAAYRLPETRSFLRARAVALLLVLLAGVPLLFATALLVFGQQIENWLIAEWGGGWWIVSVGVLLRWVGAFATGVMVIGVVYHFAPDRPQKWRYVWPGAAVTTALWLPATLLFGWYVNHIARYRDVYGSISAVVVLLAWLYIVNLIVLIGCEFNAEYERQIAKTSASTQTG